MVDSLLVNEIYLSIQGESTGCDLRCSYCDTAYAFTVGKLTTVSKSHITRLIRALGQALEEVYA